MSIKCHLKTTLVGQHFHYFMEIIHILRECDSQVLKAAAVISHHLFQLIRGISDRRSRNVT